MFRIYYDQVLRLCFPLSYILDYHTSYTGTTSYIVAMSYAAVTMPNVQNNHRRHRKKKKRTLDTFLSNGAAYIIMGAK